MIRNGMNNMTNCDPFIVKHSSPSRLACSFSAWLADLPLTNPSEMWGHSVWGQLRCSCWFFNPHPPRDYWVCSLSQEYVFYSKVKQSTAVSYTHQIFLWNFCLFFTHRFVLSSLDSSICWSHFLFHDTAFLNPAQSAQGIGHHKKVSSNFALAWMGGNAFPGNLSIINKCSRSLERLTHSDCSASWHSNATGQDNTKKDPGVLPWVSPLNEIHNSVKKKFLVWGQNHPTYLNYPSYSDYESIHNLKVSNTSGFKSLQTCWKMDPP